MTGHRKDGTPSKPYVHLDADQKSELIRRQISMTPKQLAAFYNISVQSVCRVMRDEIDRCRAQRSAEQQEEAMSKALRRT